MIRTYFPDPRVRQGLYEGPLAIHIDAFAEQLARQGYSGATAREKLRLVAHLSRWLARNNVRAEELDEACIRRFRRYRRQQGRIDHQAAATVSTNAPMSRVTQRFYAHCREYFEKNARRFRLPKREARAPRT